MNDRRGFTLWFTGLPGSGKSTIASALEKEFGRRGMRVEILDGDVVRTHLSKGLGFSKEDRDTNIRRIGWVCQLLTKFGVPNMAAAVSPYRSVRGEVRRMVEAVGGPGSFVEVFIDCPVEVCKTRDPKGMYAKAMRGEIPQFTGVSDPYEPPATCEVTLRTHEVGLDACVERILSHLTRAGLIDGHPGR